MEKFKYVGYNTHRLVENDPYYEKEIAFVEEINKELHYNSSFLKQIVRKPTGHNYLTEEEEKVALSVIQWLGTPVGQGFINKVMKYEDSRFKRRKTILDRI